MGQLLGWAARTTIFAGLACSLCFFAAYRAAANPTVTQGIASWYGEAHRGRVMANGEKFDPDKLTAASWFYPLGTQVRVSSRLQASRSVVVTITDRGPAKRLVDEGRVIDLARAAFKEIAQPEAGLVSVVIEVVE
jgi:rare lipoprotein A